MHPQPQPGYPPQAPYQYPPQQPQDSPAPRPTTPAQDLLAATMAALMFFGGGLLILFGFAAVENAFGVILGIGGAVAWAIWWRKKHGAFFPKTLKGGSVVGFAFLVGLIGLFFFLSL